MTLYSLISELRNHGKIIFNSDDILEYSHISKNSVNKYTYRLNKSYNVFKIERGEYSLTDDPFIVASQIVFPGYISFDSALYIHNLLSQVINIINIATPIRKKNITFNSTPIRFVHMNPDLMFGYQKMRKDDSYIFLADVEKTIIDILYRPDISSISSILDIPVNRLNKTRLKGYSRALTIEAVRRRLGYITDYMGIDLGITVENNTVYKLNPYNNKKGKYVAKWKIYDNEVEY